MVVLRDVSCVPTENGTVPADCVSNIMDSFDVELTKKPGKGLGLSIVARKSGPGLFISDIVSSCREKWRCGCASSPTRQISLLNVNCTRLYHCFPYDRQFEIFILKITLSGLETIYSSFVSPVN